jgi:hypothetical protein
MLIGLAQAEAPDAQPEESQPAKPPTFNEILSEAQNMGPWEENAALESQAFDEFFTRNGWAGPEHDFARDLIHHVNQIPPWDQQARQNAFLDVVQERLTLTPDQRRLLNRRMQQESFRMTINNFVKVAPTALEVIKTRASGKPFTSEQVARWTKVFRPIAEEARESIERVSRDLARTMDESQRAILKKDLDAFVERHRDVTGQMLRWEKGEWEAADWGLTNDPIQRGERLSPEERAALGLDDDQSEMDADTETAQLMAAAEAARAVPLAGQAENAAAAAATSDEHAWARYVREFCARHDCTDEQKKSAEGILKDMLSRAERWRVSTEKKRESLKAQLAEAGNPDDKTALNDKLAEAEAPLKRMFEELKKRLDVLLTAEQRSRAKPKP